jgi:hypothetical protein
MSEADSNKLERVRELLKEIEEGIKTCRRILRGEEPSNG